MTALRIVAAFLLGIAVAVNATPGVVLNALGKSVLIVAPFVIVLGPSTLALVRRALERPRRDDA